MIIAHIFCVMGGNAALFINFHVYGCVRKLINLLLMIVIHDYICSGKVILPYCIYFCSHSWLFRGCNAMFYT